MGVGFASHGVLKQLILPTEHLGAVVTNLDASVLVLGFEVCLAWQGRQKDGEHGESVDRSHG